MTDLLIGLSTAANFGGLPSPVKSAEVIFRNHNPIIQQKQFFRGPAAEIRHSKSEDLLGPPSPRSQSPLVAAAVSEDDLIAATALNSTSCMGPNTNSQPSLLMRAPGSPTGVLADRIDPEDSIRDIVTENDLYRYKKKEGRRMVFFVLMLLKGAGGCQRIIL